jgi:V/A-type H+/Na+-transporting ATPase subunit I
VPGAAPWGNAVIVPMARVRVVGPRTLLPKVIDLLQAEGVLELEPMPQPLARWVGGVPVRGDPAAQHRLEDAILRLGETVRLLAAPAGEAARAEVVLDPEAPDLAERLEAIAAEARALDERRAALEEERSVLARYEKLLVALSKELAELDGSKQVEGFGLVFRRGEHEAIQLFEEEVARMTDGAYTLILRDLDDEHTAGLLAVPTLVAPAVGRLLFERGVNEVKLPESYAGRGFADGVRRLVARRSEIGLEAARCEEERRTLAARWREPLRAALREGRNRLARLRAVTFCGETQYAFVAAGWAPEARLDELEGRLDDRFHGDVALFHEPPRRDEADTVPVMLANPRWLKPFELLLALQPLPRYGTIDPTPYMAFFFPLAFGIILGDIGHGLLALALAAVALRRGWGGDAGRRVAIIVIACGVSATLFGVLFGEFFGGLGEYFGLRPILFDRRHALVPLLIFVLALGLAQIAFGLVLGFVSHVRQGKIKEAVGRLVTLLSLAAATLAILGARDLLPAPVTTAALITLGASVVAAVVLEGLLAPLELVRTLGNVLSYSRLMAVGLASVMLAEVANRLAGTVSPAPVGIGLAALLHALNFALGLLSPAVQALRLQYVEFFDKFFVPGGRPFSPLARAT